MKNSAVHLVPDIQTQMRAERLIFTCVSIEHPPPSVQQIWLLISRLAAVKYRFYDIKISEKPK